MANKSITMRAADVRAVLAGRKTQHRIPVKLPIIDRDMRCELAATVVAGELSGGFYLNSPYGLIGSRIWVRELWSRDFASHYPNEPVWYAADDDRQSAMERFQGQRCIYSPESDCYVPFRWRSPAVMSERDSRITLGLLSLRIERLQDITINDCWAEGPPGLASNDSGPVACFRSHWESKHGSGPELATSWDQNPWVWVISFKLIKPHRF